MIRSIAFFLLVFLPLALAGCGGGPAPANNMMSDAELGNAPDPALTGAVQAPIMVDPKLAAEANGAGPGSAAPSAGGVPSDAVAADTGKVDGAGLMQAPAPAPANDSAAREALTLGGLAARQRDARTRGCAGRLRYSASWAQRLPADLPLHPQARVIEAAGAEGANCALRVVSFSTPQPVQAMVDWYYTRAVRAGYSAEHRVDGAQHILGGTRARGDAAYVLYLTARRDGGTDVDVVANNGI